MAVAGLSVTPGLGAESLNAYSIWPENWARPMLLEFEKATGIKVNFVRFSSGEALARLIAEKNTPRVDVLFGGPVETFAAGAREGIFEPYQPPAAAGLPARFKAADGSWTAIADDPLVFMSNSRFLKDNRLEPPASWEDLLDPRYKNMLQMADARTSGTAVTRIFSILEVNGRDETKAFEYMKKKRRNVQLLPRHRAESRHVVETQDPALGDTHRAAEGAHVVGMRERRAAACHRSGSRTRADGPERAARHAALGDAANGAAAGGDAVDGISVCAARSRGEARPPCTRSTSTDPVGTPMGLPKVRAGFK